MNDVESPIIYYRRMKGLEARTGISRVVQSASSEGQQVKELNEDRSSQRSDELTGALESGSFNPSDIPIDPNSKLDWPFD
jgi:hypothetical protein